MVSVTNAFDILATSEKDESKLLTYNEKVKVYLPETYISTIVNIFEIIKKDVSVTTSITYENIKKEIQITGTDRANISILKKKYDDIIQTVFDVYLSNEYGNIGRWADV